MKNKILNFTAVSLCLFASFSVSGQSAETVNATHKVSDIKNNLTELQISLDARQRNGKIEVVDSCLVLSTDYEMSIAIPFSKTFQTILPAGTKIFIPKGTYNLENLTNQPVSYLLKEDNNCSSNFISDKKEK